VFCVVDLLLLLSLLCRDGGYGLREMRAGLLQSVCQSPTLVLCSFGCVVICGFAVVVFVLPVPVLPTRVWVWRNVDCVVFCWCFICV